MSSPAGQPKCYTCGNTNHQFSNCRYKKYKCKKCNEISILQKCAEASTNYIINSTQKSEASEEKITEVFNLLNNQSIVESLKVNH